MKLIPSLLLQFCLLLVLAISASATTFCVSTAGAGFAGCTGTASSNLQTSINAAAFGDTIIVKAGDTFPGSYFLPDKGAGSTYITIQSSAIASLPDDVRVGPSSVANMPKLTGTGLGGNGPWGGSSNQPVLGVEPNAHHYKVIGFEMVPDSASTTVQSIVTMDTGGLGDPHHIIIDRCYIHSFSDADVSVVRGIYLNATDSQVRNSYISGIHGGESQAVVAFVTAGRLIIYNNYLEAASECLQLGTNSVAAQPDDVVITRNHITRPLSKRAVWGNVKNLFEMKGGTNVTFSGNLLENNWADGQTGHAIVLSAYENNISDITISNNVIRHIGAFISIISFPVPPFSPGSLHGGFVERVTVSNNLVYDIDTIAYNNPWDSTPAGGFFVNMGYSEDITFTHNTNPEGAVITLGGNDFAISPNFVYTNNISGTLENITQMMTIANNGGTMSNNLNPIAFAGNHTGLTSVEFYEDVSPTGPEPAHPQVTLYNNLTGSMFWFVLNVSEAGFTNTGVANYSLSVSSAYKAQGTGATDPGINQTTLLTSIGASSGAFASITTNAESGNWTATAGPASTRGAIQMRGKVTVRH